VLRILFETAAPAESSFNEVMSNDLFDPIGGNGRVGDIDAGALSDHLHRKHVNMCVCV
jgi:hypothetical protein